MASTIRNARRGMSLDTAWHVSVPVTAGLRRMAMPVMLGVVLLGALAVPVPAHATTLAELDQMIASAQQVCDGKQKAYEAAQADLDDATNGSYKSADGRVSDILTGADTLDSVTQGVRYGNSVAAELQGKVDAAAAAKTEADDAKAKLEALKNRKVQQQESLRNADSIHFAQWQPGSTWASRRYWGGTVATHGCGLVSYTVAMDILTGANLDPSQMLDKRGDWVGMESWPDDSSGVRTGETHAEFTKRVFGVTERSLPMDGDKLATLDKALEEDEAVVQLCGRGTIFKNGKTGQWRTSGGHYVLIYRHADGYYYVQDSTWLDEGGTAVKYSKSDMQRMLSGASSLVAYSNAE